MKFNWKICGLCAIFTSIIAGATSLGVAWIVGQPAGLYLAPLVGLIVGGLIGKLTAPLVWRDRVKR